MLKYPNFPEREKCQAACSGPSCYQEQRESEESVVHERWKKFLRVHVCACLCAWVDEEIEEERENKREKNLNPKRKKNKNQTSK